MEHPNTTPDDDAQKLVALAQRLEELEHENRGFKLFLRAVRRLQRHCAQPVPPNATREQLEQIAKRTVQLEDVMKKRAAEIGLTARTKKITVVTAPKRRILLPGDPKPLRLAQTHGPVRPRRR